MKKERVVMSFPGNPGDLVRARKLAKKVKGRVLSGTVRTRAGYRVVK